MFQLLGISFPGQAHAYRPLQQIGHVYLPGKIRLRCKLCLALHRLAKQTNKCQNITPAGPAKMWRQGYR